MNYRPVPHGNSADLAAGVAFTYPEAGKEQSNMSCNKALMIIISFSSTNDLKPCVSLSRRQGAATILGYFIQYIYSSVGNIQYRCTSMTS